MTQKRKNNISIKSLMRKMLVELRKSGSLTSSIEDEYKSVMRDYKQSLITELENITHVECVRKSIQNLESCDKKDI